MSWTLDKSRGVWMASQYSDLQYADITNLAEYGQPFSPYEKGFDQDYDPDFSQIIIEMPQSEVMTNGYGRNIEARHFPIVQRFLLGKLKLPVGTYTFADLVGRGAATNQDRRISTNLYGRGKFGITVGDIGDGDAAYIHGTVSFALMTGTRFVVRADRRMVDAEIGAADDNWDFNSSTVPRIINTVVGTAFGPDHYNLAAPIKMWYRGKGKRSVAF